MDAHPASARDFALRMVYSANAPAGRSSLSSLQNALDNFFINHPTPACRNTRVKIEKWLRDPSINPDGVPIQSRATFDALKGQAERRGYNVLVVRELDYCARQSSDFAGCAGTGTTLVIESNDDWGAKTFISLILHEKGHSHGLEKAVRPDGKSHSDSPNDLMYPTVSGDNIRLSSQECGFINADHPLFRPLLAGARVAEAEVVPEGLSQEIGDGTSEDDVEVNSADTSVPETLPTPSEPFAIVKEQWNGTPFEVLDAIVDREGLLRFARELIVDIEQQPYWGNAAKVLGIYGLHSDLNLLFFLLTQPSQSGPLEGKEAFNKMKISVIESTGFLAGRFKDVAALQRLEEIKTQLTLEQLQIEGRIAASTVDAADEQLAGGLVLDKTSPYAVPAALGATMFAVATANAAIDPDSANGESAARVRVNELDSGSAALPSSDGLLDQPNAVTPSQDSGVTGDESPGVIIGGLPNSGGYVDLPKGIDPNIVGELQKSIDEIKAAPSFESYLRMQY